MFIVFSLIEYLKEQFSLPAIVLWLKSPILLYHQYTINDSYQLFSPRLFFSVPIFLHEEMLKGGVFDIIATEIVELEKQFLMEKQDKNDEELQSLMNEHNSRVLECVLHAEKEFIRILNISDSEYSAIIEFAENEKWSFFNQKS